jgi:endoglucanase
LAAVAVVARGPVLPMPLKNGWLRGYPNWLHRAALRPEAPPFGGLAASQVGYRPSTMKQFSSPKRFASFQVMSTSDEGAFEGGPPVREARTNQLDAIRTVWIGDFTPLRAPGRYRIVADNGISSYPLGVGRNVFNAALRAVQRAFYYQRVFIEIDAEHAQGPCPRQRRRAWTARVVKGWHDAGDFSLYSASTNSALFWLLSAAADLSPREDLTGLPESGNGVPDLLDEARWGLEWLLSVQAPGGGFDNTTCQERYGPYGTNWPERTASYHLGEVGTIASGRAVGTLALASVVIVLSTPPLRSGYWRLPWPATPSFAIARSRQEGDADVGRDVRMYAAAGLLLATDDRRFSVDFEESYQSLQNDPTYRRSKVYTALLYLRGPRPATRSGRGLSVRNSAVAPRRCARTASDTPSNGPVVPSGLHCGRLPAGRQLQPMPP